MAEIEEVEIDVEVLEIAITVDVLGIWREIALEDGMTAVDVTVMNIDEMTGRMIIAEMIDATTTAEMNEEMIVEMTEGMTTVTDVNPGVTKGEAAVILTETRSLSILFSCSPNFVPVKQVRNSSCVAAVAVTSVFVENAKDTVRGLVLELLFYYFFVVE